MGRKLTKRVERTRGEFAQYINRLNVPVYDLSISMDVDINRGYEIDLVGLALEKVEPHLQSLFDRDDSFYAMLNGMQKISSRDMRIPLELPIAKDNFCHIHTKPQEKPIELILREDEPVFFEILESR